MEYIDWDFQRYMAAQQVTDAPVLAGKRYDVRTHRPRGADPTPEYIAGLHERMSYEESKNQGLQRKVGNMIWEVRCWRRMCAGLAVTAGTFFCACFWLLGQLCRK